MAMFVGRRLLYLLPVLLAVSLLTFLISSLLPGDLAYAMLGDQVRVRLAALGRDDFVVKLPNAPGQVALEPGAEVTIGFRAEDCRALAQ